MTGSTGRDADERGLGPAACWRVRALVLVVPLLIVASVDVHAAILANSGNVTPGTLSGGEDLTEGGPFEGAPGGGETVYAFQEGAGLSVSGLVLDLDAAALTVGWDFGDPTGAFPVSGSVSSHYLHFDTNDGSSNSASGFVEFDAPVLGVMVTTAALDSSDATVGSGSVSFEPGRTLGIPDGLSLEAGDRRLRFSFQNGSSVDSVRVITGTGSVGDGVTTIVLDGSESFVPNGAFEGDADGINTVYFFHEQSGVDVAGLEVDLDPDALKSGWTFGLPLQPTSVTGRVDSHYLFLDSVIDSQVNVISGSVTFPNPVLGVLFSNARIQPSDALLAIPGVSFATTRNLGTAGDALQLDATGRTLTFTFANVDQSDDVRILTATPSALPGLSPGTLGLLALVLAVSAARARRW